MEHVEFQSSKIKCGGCVTNIEKGLNGFKGITKVEVDLESNIVKVHGEQLDKSVIENKLAELGYPVV
mgnify:CR=1 FL=1